MAKWCYFDEDGSKIETDADGLKRLAEHGVIQPSTIIESQDGKQVNADKVKGLEFSSNKTSSDNPPLSNNDENSIVPPKIQKYIKDKTNLTIALNFFSLVALVLIAIILFAKNNNQTNKTEAVFIPENARREEPKKSENPLENKKAPDDKKELVYYEYKIISPSDIFLAQEISIEGLQGWEIVNARRASSEGGGAAYELLMKRRIVSTQSKIEDLLKDSKKELLGKQTGLLEYIAGQKQTDEEIIIQGEFQQWFENNHNEFFYLVEQSDNITFDSEPSVRLKSFSKEGEGYQIKGELTYFSRNPSFERNHIFFTAMASRNEQQWNVKNFNTTRFPDDSLVKSKAYSLLYEKYKDNSNKIFKVDIIDVNVENIESNDLRGKWNGKCTVFYPRKGSQIFFNHECKFVIEYDNGEYLITNVNLADKSLLN